MALGILWVGYGGFIGIMERKMETTRIYRGNKGIYWGHIGTMEKKMETTIQGLGFRVLSYSPPLVDRIWI